MWLLKHLKIHIQLKFRAHVIVLSDSADLGNPFPFETKDLLISFFLLLTICMVPVWSSRKKKKFSFLLNRNWRAENTLGALSTCFQILASGDIVWSFLGIAPFIGCLHVPMPLVLVLPITCCSHYPGWANKSEILNLKKNVFPHLISSLIPLHILVALLHLQYWFWHIDHWEVFLLTGGTSSRFC